MIEVGEYIRTKEGSIGKVNRIEQMSTGENYYVILNNKGEIDVLEQEIKAHSKNIIDLIEVGDIVNGCEVVAEKYTYIEMNFINVDSEISYGWGTGAIPESEIKTILTHEQYEQNCYKVVI